MRLSGSDGKTYTAHFRQDPNRRGHRKGRLYHGHTSCFLHAGECVRSLPGCYSPDGALGQSFCSVLDRYELWYGHLRAFRRAVDTLLPRVTQATTYGWPAGTEVAERRALRASLWREYLRRVAPGPRLRERVVELLTDVKLATTTNDPYFHQWVVERLGRVLDSYLGRPPVRSRNAT